MLRRFSHVRLCDSMNCSPPGSSSMVFFRQEYWSGLPGSPLRENSCILCLLHWQAGSLPLALPGIWAIGIWAIAMWFFPPHVSIKSTRCQWKLLGWVSGEIFEEDQLPGYYPSAPAPLFLEKETKAKTIHQAGEAVTRCQWYSSSGG